MRLVGQRVGGAAAIVLGGDPGQNDRQIVRRDTRQANRGQVANTERRTGGTAKPC